MSDYVTQQIIDGLRAKVSSLESDLSAARSGWEAARFAERVQFASAVAFREERDAARAESDRLREALRKARSSTLEEAAGSLVNYAVELEARAASLRKNEGRFTLAAARDEQAELYRSAAARIRSLSPGGAPARTGSGA